MRAVPGQSYYDWKDRANGRRAVGFVLAVLVHLLLLFLLLRLAPPHVIRPPSGGATSIFTVPAASVEQSAKRSSQRQPTQKAAAAAHAPASRPTRAPKPSNTPAQPWVLNPDLAGFDLNRVPSQPAPAQVATSAGADSGSTGTGAGSTQGAGKGPGGVQLYAAEWVREPTDAEMSPYMPAGHYAGGWADIACRTVPRFHVEDCEELGQSPPGSGLSRALREAAFQFLVRPPRINGKTMVGEWVRIHFDFIERRRKGDAPTGP